MNSETLKGVEPSIDYIELEDVIAMAIRSRKWWLSGAILMGFVGLLISLIWRPTTYITTIPFVFEVAPPLDNYSILSRFNDSVRRTDVVTKMVETVKKTGQSPRMDLSTFSARQMAKSGERLVPLKLVMQDGKLLIQWITTESGGSEDDIRIYTNAAATVLRDVNKEYIAKVANLVDLHERAETDPVLVKLMTMEASEEFKVREELNSVRRKYGITAPRWLPMTGIEASEGAYLDELVQNFEKIPVPEREDAVKNYTKIVGKLRAIRIKYRQAESDMRTQIQLMSSKARESAGEHTGITPILTVGPDDVSRIDVKVQSFMPFFVSLGFIVGSVMGAICYVVRNFWRVSRVKLVEKSTVL